MRGVLALAAVAVLSASGCGATSPPDYLTAAGAAQWHFEMRLRQRYGEDVCTSSTSPTGFVSGPEACAPHSEHAFYIYFFSKSGRPRDRVVWNLEAILHDTFGSSAICFNGTNFVRAKRGCFKYLFIGARHSAFHLTSTHTPAGSFGNYPALVRVDGRYVACDTYARTYLTFIYGTAGDSYACLAPL